MAGTFTVDGNIVSLTTGSPAGLSSASCPAGARVLSCGFTVNGGGVVLGWDAPGVVNGLQEWTVIAAGAGEYKRRISHRRAVRVVDEPES